MIINNYWTIVIAILILILIVIFIVTRDIIDTFAMGLALDTVLLILSVSLCGIMYWFCNDFSTETYSNQTELVALSDYT